LEYGLATARKRDLSRFIGRMVAPQQARSPWVRYGVAVILPFGGFLINWLVFDLQRAPYFSLFMATVVFTSLFAGRGPGFLNTALSTVLAFAVAPPAWTYRLNEREDAIRIGLFFVLGCLISIMVGVVGELQRKLNRERSTLQTILQTVGDAVITTDRDARITFLNDIAEAKTGWRLELVHGKSIDSVFQIISEDSRSQMENPVSGVLQSRTAACHVTNCLLVRRDGNEIPIVYSVTPIQSAGILSGGVLTFRDISREREAHNAVIRAEKLAAAGKLASTLAHQVNNPLEAASNLLFLIDSAPDLKAARSYAQVALQQLLRAAHFVHQTLSFARPSYPRRPVDLCRLVDEVLALHSNGIDAKGVHIVKTCAPSVQVYAHRNELEQVVSNLISNSLDAVRYGGKLYLPVKSRAATQASP
jgi:PAS domain S-box-containing protein